MVGSKSLRLGNVFNKVESLGANTQENTARSLALANTFSGIGDTLAGKDYQPGMSGFEQALIAGARGAASGFQGKAAIEQAKGQDELNAYAKTIADYEMQTAKIDQIERREQESIAQAAPAIAAATIAFAEGKTDEQTYSATVENLVKNIMQAQGREVVSVTKQGTDPFTYAVTVKDPETGETETAIRNVGKEFGGAVLKMDAGLGKAFIASAGRLPANYFQKQEKPTGKAAELQAATEALNRELTEPERMKILGLDSGTKGAGEVSDYQKELNKGSGKSDVKLLESLNTTQNVIFSTDRVIEELARTGIQTGPLSQMKAELLGGINTIAGVDIFGSPETIQTLDAMQAPQVFAAVKNLGAGTGISNADREFAAKTIGGSLTDPAVIARMQAMLKATAVRNGYFAQALQAHASNQINREELEALRTRMYGAQDGNGQADRYSLNTLASKFEQEYLQKLSAGARSRLTPAQVPAAQSTIVNQFGLDMGE